MVQIVLIRPGLTDFDEQGRIMGILDIPLNAKGTGQVAKTIRDVSGLHIEAIYSSPCQAAEQTAAAITDALHLKVKRIEKLTNLDNYKR